MSFYLLIHEQQSGPHSEEVVRAMLKAGEITRQQMAWKEGMPVWQPVYQIMALDPSPSLPPVPPLIQPQQLNVPNVPTNTKSSALRTTSGVIAIVLGVLAVMNIGGCIKAENKKSSYETYGTSENQSMILNTLSNFTGWGASDSGYDTVKSDVETFELSAVICSVGALMAGGTYMYANTRKL
jgi:hypothetical protein